ncbi:MAG TPA: sigma 54 modulation/S30EA ribosomal C-terminal domain-containing protein [Mycobacterium sp.]
MERTLVDRLVRRNESPSAPEFPDILVYSSGRADCVARGVGRVLHHRGITGGARVRVTTAESAHKPTLVQVNLCVRGVPTRVQAVISGLDDLPTALTRIDHQIVRVWAPWRPRPWPDRTRRPLTAPGDGELIRRKDCVLQRIKPLEAVSVMDAMDYDVHLFSDAEAGEDAVVYRAGPSGLRLARQRRMYPPGWAWSPAAATPPVPLVVNSRPIPALNEPAAVHRLREQSLSFLFFTDPATGRGRLLYARYDGGLGLITPVSADGTGAGMS